MAGLRRNYIPGHVHHAISRCHSEEFRFRDLHERLEYLRCLATALLKTDWQLLAFAIMSNHLHLVLLAGQMPPRLIFQPAHGAFSRWLNRRQGRIGQLFAGRYRLWAVKRPPAELIAYVHNNPVRASVVPCASESKWTSHRFYVAPESAPSWLSVANGLALASFADPLAFNAYVRATQACPRDIRWRGVRDAMMISEVHEAAGSAINVSEPVISTTATYPMMLRPQGFAEFKADFSVEQILKTVEVVVQIARTSFCGRSKLRNAVRARWLALQLWLSMRGPLVEMSSALGMSSSSASGLLQSEAKHHRQSDVNLAWQVLVRSYPQEI